MAGAMAAIWMYAKQKIDDLKQAVAQTQAVSKDQLQLTAYERLLLFTNRCSIGNLINRLNDPSLTAVQMQQLLTHSLREEFEHNITQQLYVKPAIWEAITKLKEQNIYLINEVARHLPEGATALDLNKSLLQITMQNDRATLNKTVAEAIAYEVQQQLNQQ